MGTAGKPYALPGRKPPELKKKKPAQNLRLVAVGMTKGNDTAALTRQGPPEGVKQGSAILQNYFGQPAKKKKVQPPQKPDDEYDQFRDPGFGNPEIRQSLAHGHFVGLSH
jgi:hypothetical protein